MVSKLGGQNFQTRSEFLLFVERKLQSNYFSVINLLESLTGTYSAHKDVLAERYQSSKV